jgi:hypothetical protein
LKNTKNERSRLSSALLANYLLAISLLKNLAAKYTCPEALEKTFSMHLASMNSTLISIESD